MDHIVFEITLNHLISPPNLLHFTQQQQLEVLLSRYDPSLVKKKKRRSLKLMLELVQPKWGVGSYT